MTGTLVIHDHDNLIAVFEKLDWQTANKILQGIHTAKRLHALEPEKTVTQLLGEINHVNETQDTE